MAKSLALVNKDIIQHYKLQNLLSPPEATELTKVYDELSTILDKPQSPKKEPELDHYYKLLFKFMKLLHVLKFGSEVQRDEEKEEEKEKEKEDEDDTRKTITAKRKLRFTNIPESTPPSTPPERKKLITEPPEPEEITKPPPRPITPSIEQLEKIFEDHIPQNSPHHAGALDLLNLLYSKFSGIKVIPGYSKDQDEMQLAGRLYNIKQVSKIFENLQTQDAFDVENLDDDYKQLFNKVLRPTIENHAKTSLQAVLHGFNSFLTREVGRKTRRPQVIERTALTIPPFASRAPTRLAKEGKGLGKIHLKRWQNHIR